MSRPIGVNSEDTKQFIVDIATKIFEKKGYSATSMADIKTESNLSKGTIYYHFKNKEELYLCCIKQVSKEFILNWETISNSIQTAEQKLYIWAELNHLMLQKPIMNTIYEYFVSTNKNNYDHVIKLYEPEFKIISNILEEGIKQGEFKEDLNIVNISVLIYNLITSLTNTDLYGYHIDQEKSDLYKQAIDLIVPGLKK